jgi:hypothetical protein
MVGRPFEKGKSGNPGGRPKQLTAVQALARQHTVAAIKTLAHLMQHGEFEATRRAAANDLLSRAWGNPVSPVNLGGDASGLVQVIIQKGLGDEPPAPQEPGQDGGDEG